MSQAATSLTNLLVSLAVAALLGPSEFGLYSLAFAALLLATALQTGWVGDTLTVLGERVQVAARWWQHVVTAAAASIIFPVAILLGMNRAEGLALSCLTVVWLYEEYGRRRLMAALRFGSQGVNDLIYGTVTGVAVAGLHGTNKLSVTTVLLAMAAGGCAAVLHAQLLLPRKTRIWSSFGELAFRAEVFRYGVWRSAQAGLGSAQTLAVRYATAAGVSLSALGSLELARLVAAPLMTALAGFASVLLTTTSAEEHLGRRRHRSGRLTALLTVPTAVYTALVLWQFDAIAKVVGDGYQPDRWSLAGWLLVALIIGLTQTVSVRALIELPSRTTFVLRTWGTVIGTVTATACALGGLVAGVPFGLAAGTVIAGLLLHRRLRRGAKDQEAPRRSGTSR
ncbi:hypothetical protein [Blastococcus deserti]|uniref:O-antigen/teichoic acid export membrane protein n=1 Tax=Blastococcus deserti TaxID=2259033 RepID=A0ABW4XDC7_9ACTN